MKIKISTYVEDRVSIKNTAMEERSHHFGLAIIKDCWVRRLHMVYLRSRIIMIWNINSLAGITKLAIDLYPVAWLQLAVPSGKAGSIAFSGRLSIPCDWSCRILLISNLLLSVGPSRYGLSPSWLLWRDTVQMSLPCMPLRSRKVIDEARR